MWSRGWWTRKLQVTQGERWEDQRETCCGQWTVTEIFSSDAGTLSFLRAGSVIHYLGRGNWILKLVRSLIKNSELCLASGLDNEPCSLVTVSEEIEKHFIHGFLLWKVLIKTNSIGWKYSSRVDSCKTGVSHRRTPDHKATSRSTITLV